MQRNAGPEADRRGTQARVVSAEAPPTRLHLQETRLLDARIVLLEYRLSA